MTSVFIWDWKDPVPYIEMLKYQHKNPTLHLYEYDDHGGTFSFFVFALDKQRAIREVVKSFGGDDVEVDKKQLRRIF
jgi:hypothetical protein